VGTPILRMSNLQADGWDFTDLKYVEITDVELARWRLLRGDIVFNRTNSKELVGKCEVFDRDGTWVFASYLMRLRVDRDKAEPEFVAAFLNTRAGRLQIDRESRQIIGMSNINAEEIRTLRVPLPKPPKQRELLAKLDAARASRRRKLEEADSLLNSLDAFVVEALGLAPPPPTDPLRQCWGVRLAETLKERRLDPHRFAPRTRKLRKMIESGKFKTVPLASLVIAPVSGDWGVAEDEREPDTEYVRALVIRATEFDDTENLILDSDRVRFRYLERKSFESRSLQAGDLVLEKSGGGPLQPVGRVAVIEPEHLRDRHLCFTNFVTRLRPKCDVLPVYLWAFLGLTNRCGLTESMQAQTHGIRNLKMDEYLPQPVPVPDSATQKKIAAEVSHRRAAARHLREEGARLWEEAKRQFEDALLGPAI
jgi:type I restriction enzyme S subunit